MDVNNWNDHLLKLFSPLHVLLVLYLTIGITGNSLVLFVYGFKMRTIKDGQYFIPYLAGVDLAGSVVCSTFGLCKTFMPVTYHLDVLCKMGWLLATTTTLMSVFMLVIIAIQRYNKICKQTGHIFTLKRKRVFMIVALMMSIVLSVPSVMTYDIVPFHSLVRNTTGSVCGQISGTESLMYDIILITVVSVSCGLLIILYFLVVRATHKYMKKGSINSNRRLNITVGSIDNDTVQSPMVTQNTEFSECQDRSTTFTKCSEIAYIEDKNKSHHKTKRKVLNLQKRNKRARSRITIMFMIITMIFLICSVPKLTMVLLETIIPDFWENFSDVERMILMFLHQGYILNNVANPFIYAYLDKTFRTEINRVLCCHPK